MMFFKYLAMLILSGTAAIPAHSAQLVYEIVGAGTALRFAIEEQPVPKSVLVDGFIVGDVLVEFNGVSQVRDIGFVRELSSGGFVVLLTDINLAGPQLFTGTFAAPTLLAGTFSLTGFVNRSLQYSLQVRPADTVVPEPSTWLLLIAGFGLLGGTMRGRPRMRTLESAHSGN